jgi:hypothetical protein
MDGNGLQQTCKSERESNEYQRSSNLQEVPAQTAISQASCLWTQEFQFQGNFDKVYIGQRPDRTCSVRDRFGGSPDILQQHRLRSGGQGQPSARAVFGPRYNP